MRKLLKILLILGIISLVCFGAYTLYEIVLEDAIHRIKQGVAKGVGKGIRNTLNPFKW